jgi:hypothetical protein
MNEITAEMLNALDEYTASCTVVIASANPEVPHGSGVAVKDGGEQYILTAAHVLAEEPDNAKIRVIGRPDGPLQILKGKEELTNAIANKTHPVFSSATPITHRPPQPWPRGYCSDQSSEPKRCSPRNQFP